jgi:glycosyltransferase involved in cell wall biosynthesis
MKTAMVSWEYPPQFSGGLGIHCQAITHELTKMGIEIDFYLPVIKKAKFDTPEGMTIHPVHMNQPFSHSSYLGNAIWDSVMQFKKRLEEVFHPEGIDLIHAHDWMGVFAATPIAQKYKIPLIWTVHSTEYDRSAGKSLHPAIFAVEQEALGAVKHTIAVSKRTKQILIDRYHADSDHITAIYNGIDISAYGQMAANRDYKKTDGYVLFLGRVTGQKAPDVFLEAARLVLAERKNVRFMIAGNGDMLNKLRLLAQRWKIDDCVEFTGSVFGDQLFECYKNALLYVLPARSEPFGITVLEAMAAGIPTIISSTTGAGEIVKNVQVIEPNQPKELADAILALLNDEKRRQTLGQKGAQEARKWSWKRVADQIRSVYLKILNST